MDSNHNINMNQLALPTELIKIIVFNSSPKMIIQFSRTCWSWFSALNYDYFRNYYITNFASTIYSFGITIEDDVMFTKFTYEEMIRHLLNIIFKCYKQRCLIRLFKESNAHLQVVGLDYDIDSNDIKEIHNEQTFAKCLGYKGNRLYSFEGKIKGLCNLECFLELITGISTNSPKKYVDLRTFTTSFFLS